MMNNDYTANLPDNLKNRLNLIKQTVPGFWGQKHYPHFINTGPTHSDRVQRQKLAQLIQALPEEHQLTVDEVFIVSAAAWLYEIGLQSPTLKPILEFDYCPGETLSFACLNEIRAKKHRLTERLILDSIQGNYTGPPLGLLPSLDDYTWLIAEVCRWCSPEPLAEAPEGIPVNGCLIRVRLLAALLRLADQLYIDPTRVNLELLKVARLPVEQLIRWWIYHYTQVLQIERNQIRFFYRLPKSQHSYLSQLRTLIEPDFDYDRNPTIKYLWDNYDLHLVRRSDPLDMPELSQPGWKEEMGPELIAYLEQMPFLPAFPGVPVTEPADTTHQIASDNYIVQTVSGTAMINVAHIHRESTSSAVEPKIIKILILAANPFDTKRLAIDREQRDIDEVLQKAQFRDRFELMVHQAVRRKDLQALILRYKPDIVHFSGHGSKSGKIILEDDNGNAQTVPQEALTRLFQIFKDRIQCVVLNACLTLSQAQGIAAEIKCVVGMSRAVTDGAAIEFAASFYQALAYGESVRTAYLLGCNAIAMDNPEEEDVPQLLLRPGIDASTITFV